MSTLRYSPGEYLAGSVIREFFEAVSDELVRRGYPAVTIVSGTRLYETQEAIFRSRYVPASQVGSRFVYDFQWWNGVLWARVSSAGRVAPPSREAPHVANIAADVGAPYNVYGSARDAMFRVISDLGLTGRCVNNGTSFGEVWHWESRVGAGSIGRPAGAGGSTTPKEWDEMASPEEIASIVRAEVAQIRADTAALTQRSAAQQAQIDKLVDWVGNEEYGIRVRVKLIHDFMRLKIDALWKWALGRKADEQVEGFPADSKLRTLVVRESAKA
ncbi:hypothetical protein [Microbacterium binotii]|uniref:Endolysin n=1 Tax=Microbacterium binotii TaxID=462710 RepID=A0ABN3PC55_9MICO